MTSPAEMAANAKQHDSMNASGGIVSMWRFLVRLATGMLPPFIYQPLIHFRSHRSFRFFRATYFGVYKTFRDVAQAFPSSHYYYYNDRSLRELEQRRLRHITACPENLEPNERYNFLSTLVALQPHAEVVVLDIGGGFGEAFDYVKLSCPGKRVRYIVVELPQVVELAQQTIRGQSDIEFCRGLDEIGNVDLVFFGSSFQYFENRFEMLRSLLELTPTTVAICDSRMGDMPAFVTAQVNLPGRIIPSCVNNRSEVVEFFSRHGYALINQLANARPDNFNNFPQHIKNTARSWSLVFKKAAS